MGNDGFPGGLGVILGAAVLGALLVGGLVVGLLVGAGVSESTGPLAASFSAEVVAGTTDVLFSADGTDGTTGGSQLYKSYEWDFGDGNVEEGEGAEFRDLAHNYTSSGTYIVTLTVTDAEDNEDSVAMSVTV